MKLEKVKACDMKAGDMFERHSATMKVVRVRFVSETLVEIGSKCVKLFPGKIVGPYCMEMGRCVKEGDWHYCKFFSETKVDVMRATEV